jgi:hypothetical protein
MIRHGKITVAEDFPLRIGETLRIRLGGSRELRVRVGEGTNGTKPHTNTFKTELWYHQIGTNKDSISMVGNERKLRRV